MKLLAGLMVFVVLGLDPSQEPLVCSLEEFGSVCSLGDYYDPLCPCGSGIVLIDCEGQILPVSIGPRKQNPHSGFLLGDVNPGSEKSFPVEIGSPEEGLLVSKIWEYLIDLFGTEERARIATVSGESEVSDERSLAAYLVRMVLAFERKAASREWLNSRFSPSEQDRIFSSDFADLESDLEREAYKKICGLRGGHLVFRLPRLENAEFGLYSEEGVDCQ